jgi:hypothetical protein
MEGLNKMTIIELIALIVVFLMGVGFGSLCQQVTPSKTGDSMSNLVERMVDKLPVGEGYVVTIQKERQDDDPVEVDAGDEWKQNGFGNLN